MSGKVQSRSDTAAWEHSMVTRLCRVRDRGHPARIRDSTWQMASGCSARYPTQAVPAAIDRERRDARPEPPPDPSAAGLVRQYRGRRALARPAARADWLPGTRPLRGVARRPPEWLQVSLGPCATILVPEWLEYHPK